MRRTVTALRDTCREGSEYRREARLISPFLNGDWEHISTDLQIRILASLGYKVRVSVVKSAA